MNKLFNQQIVCCYLLPITKYGYPPPAEATLQYLEEMKALGFQSIELEGREELGGQCSLDGLQWNRILRKIAQYLGAERLCLMVLSFVITPFTPKIYRTCEQRT